MSELHSTAQVPSNQDTKLTPIKQVDAALKACTFGYFHIKLLLIAFVGNIAGVFISTSTGYLLPVAECDLQMTLLRKGVLNAMPYTGMLFSSIVSGLLTGAIGRKFFLVFGFSGVFVFNLVAASSQTFEVLVTAKFFEGLLFGAAFSSFMALTAEFCCNNVRDRVILFQTSFTVIAQIVIALLSWAILTNDWRVSFFDGKFVLNTWNFYLYAMSMFPLAACIMYAAFVPESPKYLVTQKKYDEAREILIKIYVQNTRKPANTYPFLDIWKNISESASDEDPENQVKDSFKHQVVVGLLNIKPMFRKPLLTYLCLICTTNFIIMCMYNVFRLWFPQLSAIVENYHAEDNQEFCSMLDAYTANLKLLRNTTQNEVCVPTKSGDETYINSIIVGCVSLVPFLITGILVNKVGKKRLLMAAGFVCVATTMSIRWANGKIIMVSLFSITIALARVMLSLNQTLTIETFGTTTRTLAISFMMVTGRIGTLTGNVSFPVLLDMGCEVPFFTISALLVCFIVLSLFIPNKKQSKK
ncbi:unnamed protein product [Arctia plantaginis]|uniref:Major facilitator superfamily (MFS) profile domain-containing protein n=1 Tax=Arctia plantaginis TaxID=874455 RepID=A0A8S1B0A1_ARCPL|nr:unnamed protein product [Arctia plantaginis]